MCTLFVICTHVTPLHWFYNFALLLHENALVFSHSEACNFFIYFIIYRNGRVWNKPNKMTHYRCQSLWFFGLTSFLLGLLLGFPYDISGQSRWPVEPFEKNTRLFCKQMTCQLLVSAEIKFQLRVPYWMQVLYL